MSTDPKTAAMNGQPEAAAEFEMSAIKAGLHRWSAKNDIVITRKMASEMETEILASMEQAGLVFAIRTAAGEMMPHKKAEAAVDRSRAMKGRLGYEAHPDFGKGMS